jgi:hypothetical protein
MGEYGISWDNVDVNGSLHKSFERAISTDYNIWYVEHKPTPLLEKPKRQACRKSSLFVLFHALFWKGTMPDGL